MTRRYVASSCHCDTRIKPRLSVANANGLPEYPQRAVLIGMSARLQPEHRLHLARQTTVELRRPKHVHAWGRLSYHHPVYTPQSVVA